MSLEDFVARTLPLLDLEHEAEKAQACVQAWEADTIDCDRPGMWGQQEMVEQR